MKSMKLYLYLFQFKRKKIIYDKYKLIMAAVGAFTSMDQAEGILIVLRDLF